MRGACPLGLNLFLLLGITPAHAGSIMLHNTRKAISQDHPRACGEHTEIEEAKP